MIKSCVIGLSKVGIIHCKSLIKIKNTSLNYIFDKNYNLSKRLSKKFKCNTTRNFDSILKKRYRTICNCILQLRMIFT